MHVPILKQGPYLIASIQSVLSDSELFPAKRRPGGSSGENEVAWRHHRCNRAGGDGLLCLPRFARPREHDQIARRRGGHCRHSA